MSSAKRPVMFRIVNCQLPKLRSGQILKYRVRIEHEAERQIERLAGNIRQRVKRTIAELAVNPRPANAKHMETPYEDKWRLRLEHYRIIYTIEDEIVLVTVIRVAKRTPSTYDDL